MYQHRPGAKFFAEQGTEIAQRGYATLTGLEPLARVAEDTVQFVDHPGSLPERPFGEFFELMRSTFQGENELRLESNETLWNPIIDAKKNSGKKVNKTREELNRLRRKSW